MQPHLGLDLDLDFDVDLDRDFLTLGRSSGTY